jgi:hypothetical protein
MKVKYFQDTDTSTSSSGLAASLRRKISTRTLQLDVDAEGNIWRFDDRATLGNVPTSSIP